MATMQRKSGDKTCRKCGAELWDDGSCPPCDWRRPPGQWARPSGRQHEDRRSSWLDDWWRPFIWIILTPIVTVPVSAIIFSALIRQPEEAGFPPNNPQSQIDLFQGGSCDSFLSSPCYEYAETGPALLAFAWPGLLNLAPVVWVLSKNTKAKAAGLVALLLGALRFAIPLLVLMFGYKTVTNPEGTSYFRWDTLDFILPSEPTFAIWLLGALAWFGSLLVWAAFAVISRGKEGAGLASVFLVTTGLVLLLLGWRALSVGIPYAALSLFAISAAVLCFGLAGLKPRRPGEAR